MNINKKYELNISEKDIYALAVVDNIIIINDEYKGIIVFDYSLQQIKSIFILGKPLIYSTYTHYTKNEMILYDPDNYFLIWVDIDSGVHTLTSISMLPENIIFSSVYYWNDDEVIFTCYGQEAYIFNPREKIIKPIDVYAIEKQYPEFFAFWMYTKLHVGSYFFPKQQVIINNTREKIQLIEFPSLIKKEFLPPSLEYHDIVYNYDICVFIAEKGIEIIDTKTYERTALIPQQDYRFVRARFMKHDNQISLVVLSLLGNYDSTITVYEINQSNEY
jgi:hypothetical protein